MTFTEADNKSKALINKDFLDRLVELGRLYGWSGDYSEIKGFIETLFEYTDFALPDLTPYQITND